MATSTPLKAVRTTKAQIRRAAMLCALVLFLLGVILALCLGASVGQAIGASAAGVMCNQAAWWTYHLVGGRNNGRAFCGMSLWPFMKGATSPGLVWGAMLASLIVMVPMAYLAAKTVGALERSKPVPGPHPPMHDSQVDGA